MILIVSSQDDFSTHEVIDWLNYYQYPFMRISNQDFIETIKIHISVNLMDIRFRIKEKIFCMSDFESVWYRRSWITPNYKYGHSTNQSVIQNAIQDQILSEKTIMFELFQYNLYNKSINNPFRCNLNKLKELQFAKEVGLKIPYTEVLTEKKDLLVFKKHCGAIITKSASQGVFVSSPEERMNCLTIEVSDKMIQSMSPKFAPSLFQERIDKLIELRIFFLNKLFYSSAIFSQNDSQTKIDFRNYNYKSPNRVNPIKLPTKIEKKLLALMNKLELNSGSVDMILSKEGEYVFLEVNPVGQFKQVSKPCNYYLEQIIAKTLIKRDEKNKI